MAWHSREVHGHRMYLRRAAATLLLALLLQPQLLVGRADCDAVSAGAHVASRDLPAHDMASMHPASMHRSPDVIETTAPAQGPIEDCQKGGTPHRCDGPLMPSGCTVTGACATVALSSAALHMALESAVSRERTSAPLALRAGTAAPPEPPPPRA